MKNPFSGIKNQPLSESNYKRINRYTELITKIINYIVIYFFLPASAILLLIVNFYMYYSTNLGVEAFRLPFPYWYILHAYTQKVNRNKFINFFNRRFPFDWKNPRGYLVASTLSFVLNMNVMFFLICDMCIGVGFYIFATVLTKDIKNDFKTAGVWFESEPNPTLLSKQFFDLIYFHSMMKRCVYACGNFVICHMANDILFILV